MKIKLYTLDNKFIEETDMIPENFTGILTTEFVSKLYFKNGKRHREDGPAREDKNGLKIWYVDDKRHRLDGPAYDNPDGTKYWHIQGIRYSEKQSMLLRDIMKLKGLL